MGDGTGIHIDDAVTVPVDDEPFTVGDFTDDRGRHIPFAADLHETFHVPGFHHRHHAFLRLAHQDFLGREVRVTQRHEIEVDGHATVAGGGQLRGGAGDSGRPEVLDADDDAGLEQFEGALDEQLLHERVADLNAGAFRGSGLVEGLGGQDGCPADAVPTGGGSEEDHLVAHPGGVGAVQVLVSQHPDAQRIDEGIAEICPVELHLAADVRQSQAVAVAAYTGDDTGQDPAGVGLVERTETQRIHHTDGPGPHREDVADDAANASGRSLVGLHEARVVVGLRLERDGIPLSDVDDTGVLADTRQEWAARGVLAEFTEFLQVHLRGFVGAVLRPHHRVHRQFGAGGAAAEDLPDACVLVILHTERRVRLLQVGGFQCMSHGVCHESKSIG